MIDITSLAERQQALIEDIEFLIDHNEPDIWCRLDLGINRASLVRRLQRWGRQDLARVLDLQKRWAA